MTHADLLKLISQLSSIIADLEYAWERPLSPMEAAILRQLQAIRETVRKASEDVRFQEYTDIPTGTYLCIEHDNPEHPRTTIVFPEHHHLTTEEANAALRRLYSKAGLPPQFLTLPFSETGKAIESETPS